MALTTLIAAKTAADTSTAFAVAGEAKIICNLSVDGEQVILKEEHMDGVYRDVADVNGVGVCLTPARKSAVFVGYGNYKVTKTATAAAVAVGLES